MNDLELLHFKNIIVRPDGYKVDITSSIAKLSELTMDISIKFAMWIADYKLHGRSQQLHEAMIINKVRTAEELFQFFINNVYKSE